MTLYVYYILLTVCCLFVLFCFVVPCFVSVDFFFCVASGELFAVYVCLFFVMFCFLCFLLWQVARVSFVFFALTSWECLLLAFCQSSFYLLFVFVFVFCWRCVFGFFDIVFFFLLFLMYGILLQWQDYRACRPRNGRFGPLYRHINRGSGVESSGHKWSIIW